MDDGVEALAGNRRQPGQTHALVPALAVVDIVGAAVHGHVVAARRQPASDLFDVVLDAAERGGHASRADEGDSHQTRDAASA